MSERKVLNKYYPPDFDAEKLEKYINPPQYRGRRMRCNKCGEYIYKSKKFNARQETIYNETYLGLQIYRFYIKCPNCMSDIAFKTDPKNTDYELEHGAKRCFDLAKLAEKKERRERERRVDDDDDELDGDGEAIDNSMQSLEKRTLDSKHEMDMIEKLEEIREMNKKHTFVDLDKLLAKYTEGVTNSDANKKVEIAELANVNTENDEEDEKLVQAIFSNRSNQPEEVKIKTSFFSDSKKCAVGKKKKTVKNNTPKNTALSALQAYSSESE